MNDSWPGAVELRMRHLGTLFALALTVTSPAMAQMWPELTDDAGIQGGGENDAALVVGVTNYFNLPKIEGAAKNAEAWQQWLLRSRKVPATRVELLTDRFATREKIERNLEELGKQVGPGGTLWFIFIGHGAPDPTGTDGLLLGADTDSDSDSLSARGVLQDRVLALIGQGNQANSVVIFDACFSGKTGDGAAPLVKGLMATLPTRRRGPPPSATVLAASDSFAGPLPSANRPAFSYLLLGALRGWADENGDKSVDVDEAHEFARSYIQRLFKGSDRLPSKRGPSMVLARNVKEKQPDMAALVSGKCPSGWAWGGRECKELPAVKCPEGSRWNSGACESVCPTGTSWKHGGCVSTSVKCPEGTDWNGNACVSPPSVDRRGFRVAPKANEGAARLFSPQPAETSGAGPYGFAERSPDVGAGVDHASTALPAGVEGGSPLLRYGIYWALMASGVGLAVTGVAFDTVPGTSKNQQFDVADLAGPGLYVAAVVAVGVAAVAPLPGAPEGASPLGLEPLGFKESPR